MDEALHAAISTVIPHCYGTVAPANAPLPYAIWQRIGGEAPEYLDNEEPQLQTATVQVRVYSKEILEPKVLVEQLTRALRQHPDLLVRPNGGFRDDYDHDMELFYADQDFDVNY